MKRFITLLLILMSTSIYAAIYQIPVQIQKEIKENKATYEANPESLDARFNLAMSYAYSGQIRIGWSILKEIPPTYSKTVINTYQPLTLVEPQEWRHFFKLAFGYYFESDKLKAISLFKKVLEIEPKHVWAMGFIALIKGEMGNVDESIQVCQKALKIEPNATAIHFLLGEAYRRKGHYVKFLSQMMTVGRLEAEEAVERKKD